MYINNYNYENYLCSPLNKRENILSDNISNQNLMNIDSKNLIILERIEKNLKEAKYPNVWSYVNIDWVIKRIWMLRQYGNGEDTIQCWYWSYHIRDDWSCSYSGSLESPINVKIIKRSEDDQLWDCRFFSCWEGKWNNWVDVQLLFPIWNAMKR